MIVRALITVPPAGMSIPKPARSALRPADSRTPKSSPKTDARRPTTSDSPSTDSRTWRPLAPIARSRAISRIRWATMIENVLKMMKQHTNSAMRAKIVNAVLKNERPCWIAFWFSSVSLAPVITWIFGSAIFSRIRSTSVCCEIPGVAGDRDAVELPDRLGDLLRARGVVNCTVVAPPGESASPNFAMPLTVYFAGACWVSTVTWSRRR